MSSQWSNLASNCALTFKSGLKKTGVLFWLTCGAPLWISIVPIFTSPGFVIPVFHLPLAQAVMAILIGWELLGVALLVLGLGVFKRLWACGLAKALGLIFFVGPAVLFLVVCVYFMPSIFAGTMPAMLEPHEMLH